MGMLWTSGWATGRRVLLAAVDLVLPARCAACHAAGGGPLCSRCTTAVRTSTRGVAAVGSTGSASAAAPPCWSAARFEGAVRLAVTAYKDEERRDLQPVLGRLLGAALLAASHDPAVRARLGLGEEVLVVPVPTGRASRRRRGDDPVGALAVAAAAAVNGTGGGWAAPAPARRHPPRAGLPRGSAGALVVAPVLAHTRRVADQAHLDRRARARNLAGAMTVDAAWRQVVLGATCVLVDDVVTTGATLAEAARALHDAGARHVVAATCATTPRRCDPLALWPNEPPTSVSA